MDELGELRRVRRLDPCRVGVLESQARELGRIGAPGDIAETVAFLVSDGSSYVTGQNIVVGGGIEIA